MYKLKGNEMIRNFVILCLSIMLFSSVLSAQQVFEGIVEVTITNNRGEENDLKFYTSENAFRLESEEGEEVKNGNLLVKDDSIYVLMPEEERYIQMPINVHNRVQNYARKADNLKKTGETKEILGYQAEKWLFIDNGATVEIWSTKELGNIVNLANFLPEAADEVWYKNIFEEGFFPLSMTVTNKNRNTVSKIEVTKVEKQDLEDDEFLLPDGFRRMQTRGTE